MQVSFVYDQKEETIDFKTDLILGQQVYEIISQKIQQNLENFDLLIQTQQGFKHLQKYETLKQYINGQQQQIKLLVDQKNKYNPQLNYAPQDQLNNQFQRIINSSQAQPQMQGFHQIQNQQMQNQQIFNSTQGLPYLQPSPMPPQQMVNPNNGLGQNQLPPGIQVQATFPNMPIPPILQPPNPIGQPYPNPGQLNPPPFNQFIPNNRISNQTINQNRVVDLLQEDIDNLNTKLNDKESQIRKLNIQIKDEKSQNEQEIDELKQQVTAQRAIARQYLTDINKLKNEISNQKSEIKNLQEQNDELQAENDRLKRRQQIFDSQSLKDTTKIQMDDQGQINELKKQKNDLSKQLRDKEQKINQLNSEIDKLRQDFEYNHNNNTRELEAQNYDLQNAIKQQNQRFKILESQIQQLSHQAYVEQKKREDRDREIFKLKETLQDVQNQLEIQFIVTKNDKQLIQQFQEAIKFQNGDQRRDNFPKNLDEEIKKYEKNMMDEIQKRKEMNEKIKDEEQEALKKLYQQRNKAQKERDQEKKLQRQQKAMKLREFIMSTQGILQVGLLVDVTGSMDTYKEATMNIIQKSLGCIKSQTNRDCEWGAVCYQDFAELKQKGQYLEHSFTKDQNQMINFLKNIVCDGGDDGAEDLRNGIKQMVKNLQWGKYFKIALLICDAPSHGKKWAGNVLDDYPDEDLGDALQLLINKNIVLIGIEFDQRTDVMFAQMKNFYERQNKGSLLITLDLKNKNAEQIQDSLVNIISEASISITEVSKQGTKTKNQNIVRDGAFEALVKRLPDPTKFNLDPSITTIETKFNVYKVEILQNAFEENITQIYKIVVPRDYDVKKESEWDCIRTLKPFAFGQLKEVYLMKKKDANSQDEVYVIKMPIGGETYKSMNQALQECRSHLISKRLMQKFIQDLNEKGFQTPPIRYSDFLILQEHDTSYWIAERFFNGEFVKFNNNYGYVNPNKDQLNILAQVFSYYTYHISDLQYMICDVQGVGHNFTDPAINTAEDNFDETDQGPDGIGQFIISFEKDKKDRYQQYLEILDLKD